MFEQSGPDLFVRHGAQFVRLAVIPFSGLTSSNLIFQNGSVALLDTSANNFLNGTGIADYIDIRKGGDDTVSGGGGNDRIVAESGFSVSDTIDGGSGTDELILSGTISAVLTSATLTSIEKVVFRSGAQSLTFASNTASLIIDAAAQSQADSVNLNGSAMTAGAMSGVLGAGNDTFVGSGLNDSIDGGDGTDQLTGGSGADTLRGGLGSDTLTGGSGSDIFLYGFPSGLRSESSVNIPDIIMDFEGAGATGGDIIDLPAQNLGSTLLIFNQAASTFNYTGPNSGLQNVTGIGDGFVDVYWKFDVLASQIELWVDTNDDGLFSETDLRIRLVPSAGSTTFAFTDLAETFRAWRGTTGPDNVAFNNANNLAYGVAGSDTLSGLGGNDQLYGGAGNDSLDGGLASDQLFGEADNDTLQGGDGNDFLDGGLGSDTLEGGNDADDLRAAYSVNDLATDQNLLNGGAGNDSLFGSAGLDTLNGGTDNDSLNGGANADQLNGEDGNDILNGDSGDDALNGGAGLDTLYGGEGVDTMTGGTGADEFRFESRTPATQSRLSGMDVVTDFQAADGDKLNVYPFGGRAFRVFRGSLAAIDVSTGPTAGLVLPGSDLGTGFSQFWWIPALSGGAPAGGWLVSDSNNNFELNGDDFVVRVGSLANPVTITQADFVATNFLVQAGTPGPDSLTGGAANDTIYGVAGSDTLSGLGGNDQLYGGAGNDSLTAVWRATSFSARRTMTRFRAETGTTSWTAVWALTRWRGATTRMICGRPIASTIWRQTRTC